MKNGRNGTRPAYKFMVIVPILHPMVIQSMIFIAGKNLAPSMLCSETPPAGLLFFAV